MITDCEPSSSSSSSVSSKMPPSSSRSSPSPEDPSTSEANQKNSTDEFSRTRSPPSKEKCPICLGVPVDESKTEACQHRFCFVCLVEWSKIKTQCPMCKTPFKKIIHNTKSDESGETCEIFDVPEPAPPEPAQRRARFQAAMGRERSELLRQIRELQTRLMIMDNARRTQDPFEQMRQRYQIARMGGRSRGSGAFFDFQRTRDAMMAARAEQGRRVVVDSLRRYQQLYDDSENATREELIGNPDFRRLIYERGLRVLPMETEGRVRDCSPRFLCQNEAMRNRLIAWLTRELSILLHNDARRVSSVTALIIDLLQQYDMNREEFRTRIRAQVPHFEHFMHEFASFAQSPYDLPEYDRRCEYQRRGTSPVPVEPGERQMDANDSDILVVAESARLREVVQRQAEAVRLQTEAADRSTAAIHAAMANITAHITRFSQSPLTNWLRPSVNMGPRVDDPSGSLAYNNPIVRLYDPNNAPANSIPNRGSRNEDYSSRGDYGNHEDHGYAEVELISSTSAGRNVDVQGGERNERRRRLAYEDVEEEVGGGTVDDDDVQLLIPEPVRRAASSPNLREQLEAIMNGTVAVGARPVTFGARPRGRMDGQRQISLIDISSPPLSSDGAASSAAIRVRSESPQAGPSHGYRASWATSSGRAPGERDKSTSNTRNPSTYAYFDSDASTPSPPPFLNTFRLVEDAEDDVIIDSASSDTTFGFVDSAPSTPSPVESVSISDLNHFRRIEREVEDAIELGRRQLQTGREGEGEDVGTIPLVAAVQQPSVQQAPSNWSDDSDVEVIAELKPKHLRTPPLVELLDDMDDELPVNQDNNKAPVKVEKEESDMPSTSAATSSSSRKRQRSPSPTRSRDREDSERRRHKKHHKKHKKHRHRSSPSSSKHKKRRRHDSPSEESDDSDGKRRHHRKRRRANSPTESGSSSDAE
uniref:RING-type E3 ubiquitin transferase n=1 Tax=Plectus sambesii TaxID=2011161 RepID=A0A914VXN1_9BILA